MSLYYVRAYVRSIRIVVVAVLIACALTVVCSVYILQPVVVCCALFLCKSKSSYLFPLSTARILVLHFVLVL